ncbi:TPA_asm: protein 3 [Tanacetum virus 1]|uniref:Protein 3 n=1 Tax=Tanacetum virus 1 TaxID=2977993 RepID=A0A9N7AB19_9RHAB|nr:TPA_asm: protein 3 [Tanacetum virus 1]
MSTAIMELEYSGFSLKNLVYRLNHPFSNITLGSNDKNIYLYKIDGSIINNIVDFHNETRGKIIEGFQNKSFDGFCWLCDSTELNRTSVVHFKDIEDCINTWGSDKEIITGVIESLNSKSIDLQCFMKTICSETPFNLLMSMMNHRSPKLSSTEDLSNLILTNLNDSLYHQSFNYQI